MKALTIFTGFSLYLCSYWNFPSMSGANRAKLAVPILGGMDCITLYPVNHSDTSHGHLWAKYIWSTNYEEAVLPARSPLRCVVWAIATANHSQPHTGAEWGHANAMHQIQLTMQPDDRKHTHLQGKTSCTAYGLYTLSTSEKIMACILYKNK